MNCAIVGNFVNYLEIELAPGEEFYGQRGALICCDNGIEKEVCLSGGGGVRRMIGAKFSGESIFILRFINKSDQMQKLTIGGRCSLMPINLQNESVICHHGVYTASNKLVNVTSKISLSGIVGGMGLFLQKITGTSTVFLDTVGKPIVKSLQAGDVTQVDEDHIIALQGISEDQLEASWSLKNVLGGEGLSVLRIYGPGTVYLSPGTLRGKAGAGALNFLDAIF